VALNSRLVRWISTQSCHVRASRLPFSLYTDALLGHRLAMPFKRPALETEAEIYEVALRALMRRAHSVSEMKKLLARRTNNELLVQVVMARLKESGQLDDSRYAQQFVRQRKEIRRQGAFRIARELRARGVPNRHIDEALEKAADPEAERTAIRHRIERKLKSWRGEVDEKKTASLYRSLLRAGFPGDAIRRELKELGSEELPEDEANSDEA
jgi:regulatory protein